MHGAQYGQIPGAACKHARLEQRGQMSEGSRVEALEAAGSVRFQAGDAAVGEFHCSECGYGVTVLRELPPCPMCRGTAWEQSAWSPFLRAARQQLL